MKTTQRFSLGAFALAALLGLGGCSGMSTQDKNLSLIHI